MSTSLYCKGATGVNATVGSDMLSELERIRLEQAKTNELLRQILVPLAFISSCCSAMLGHIQQLAASCTTATLLLEDCSQALRAILLNTSHVAALLFSVAATATREGLLNEHAVHASRGMHVAVAACLLAGGAVGLPYRWRACRAPPLMPYSRWGLITRLDWRRLFACPPLERDWRPAAGALRAPGGWGLGLKNGGGGAQKASPVGVATAETRWWFWSIGGGSGSGGAPSPWGWWLGAVARLSVLACRTRMTGGFLAGALILLLWTAARLTWGHWWQAARTCRSSSSAAAPAPAVRAQSSNGGGTFSSGGGGGFIGRARSPLAAPLLQPPSPLAQRQPGQETALFAGDRSSLSLLALADVAAEGRGRRCGGWRLGGCGAASLTTTMWWRSVRHLLVHSPAWFIALALMGGSPTVWLTLQLTWHALLPYAISALVSRGDDTNPVGDGADALTGVYCRQPCGNALLGGGGPRDKGDVGSSSNGFLPGAPAAAADVSAADRVVRQGDLRGCGGHEQQQEAVGGSGTGEGKAGPEGVGSGWGGSCGPNSSNDVGGDGGNGAGCSSFFGLRFSFGLRSRFRSGSASSSKPGAKSRSGFVMGLRRSKQLRHIPRHGGAPVDVGSSYVPAAAAAADGGGGGDSAAAAVTQQQPSPLALHPWPQEALEPETSAAAAQLGNWNGGGSGVAAAAARSAGPLLAAAWLYGGPLLAGAAPVLPTSWLWGRLTEPSMALLVPAGLTLVAVAAAARR